jgi:glycosyltransferase involved in cell wall biosynthesis
MGNQSAFRMPEKMELATIIVPAYRAEAFIHRSVESAIQQTYDHWEMLVVADDGQDYQAILSQQGIVDERLRFASTGTVGTGPSNARNVGLAMAHGNIITFLDADDEFYPQKLEYFVPAILKYGLVTCAVDIFRVGDGTIRWVGKNHTEGLVPSQEYMFINFSTNTMVGLDRRAIPCQFDRQYRLSDDTEFILSCFTYTDRFYHFSQPFHRYYKQPNSLTSSLNSDQDGRDFNIACIEFKKKLIQRLSDGYYNFVNPATRNHFLEFFHTSMQAELVLEQELQQDPNILFEDVIESLFVHEQPDVGVGDACLTTN